jgi:hypothetical protein
MRPTASTSGKQKTRCINTEPLFVGLYNLDLKLELVSFILVFNNVIDNIENFAPDGSN